MKVYISADMEGVAGVVNQEQLRPEGFEFQQFREFMTAELIAYLPNVERIDNHTVRFVGNIIEVSMFIEMAMGYPSTL